MADPGFYHEFQSEVEDSVVGGIIKPQAHWNAKHKPVKLLGYELVEEKSITSGQSSITFNGLNGDVDEEYLLEYKITQAVTGTNSVVYIQLNSNSSGYYSEVTRWWGTSGDAVNYADRFGLTRHGANGQTLYQKGKVELDVKSGLPRFCDASGVSKSPTETVKHIAGGTWGDTSANVTDLIFGVSVGLFTGKLRLWKKLPINED
ncbi:hypothetical protein [Methanobacterium sp.]|uniref:hypothetical protein n=1 Tax=Methanobacterium sp. TaxID=2164 RepID=UPI002AB982B9|nr:hypothetical protein [Methanobacterium sp.]MDY9922802.1 hypothetical protein [Methanobacterium sp.]